MAKVMVPIIKLKYDRQDAFPLAACEVLDELILGDGLHQMQAPIELPLAHLAWHGRRFVTAMLAAKLLAHDFIGDRLDLQPVEYPPPR